MTLLDMLRRKEPQATREAPVETPSATQPTNWRRVAVDRIVAETGCSRNTAKKTIHWIGGFVERARASEYYTQYPTAGQLCSPLYVVFDKVIPHGKPSKPGSAHEAIERALLDPSCDEFSLRHDMESREYCAVDILVGQMH